jgi:pyruvate decarboxylase
MKGVLRKVIEKMGYIKPEAIPLLTHTILIADQKNTSDNRPITHDWFWPSVGGWLKEKDIVITETGTANFGIWDIRFPTDVTAISQVLWGSIGCSLGACQGAALAAKETGNRRTVLFVGDGSLQLTAQEISTMIRHQLSPIM